MCSPVLLPTGPSSWGEAHSTKFSQRARGKEAVRTVAKVGAVLCLDLWSIPRALLPLFASCFLGSLPFHISTPLWPSPQKAFPTLGPCCSLVFLSAQGYLCFL